MNTHNLHSDYSTGILQGSQGKRHILQTNARKQELLKSGGTLRGKMFPFSNKLAIPFACIPMKELRLYFFTTTSRTKYLPDTSEALQHPFLEIKKIEYKSD